MNSRERVQCALSHREPDRVPIEFGSSTVSGIHALCVERLRAHYGLERRPVKVSAPTAMLGLIEEDLAQALGLDCAGVLPRNTALGYPNEHWKEFRTPWGQVVLMAGGFQYTVDSNGDLLAYPQGDLHAPPSGRMPPSSYYLDAIIRQEELLEGHLDPADNLEEFAPLSEQDIAHFRREVEAATATGRAIIVSLGGASLGDIAVVPGIALKQPKGIRDIAEWYISLHTRREYVAEVFARQCDIALERLAQLYRAVGDAIDIVYLCGTDFGTQDSLFCSLERFEELWASQYRRLNSWVHAHTPWKTMKHSCGAVEPLIGALIEVGFDVLNPVQCSAAGMDPRRLKAQYGDRIVFLGGGVDTQTILPFGTTEDVRQQVLERCEMFGKDGGFIFNTVHCVQANTPLPNVLAMIEALHEFNGTAR